MPEHKMIDELLASISEQLQALVQQQDEIIKYLTGSTREELRAAAELKKAQ